MICIYTVLTVESCSMPTDNKTNFNHATPFKTGVLIVNLGTPDAPTPSAVRRYLDQFLSDPRVIDKPRWLWWLILHGIILRLRPYKAAHAYKQIWTEQGSPLLTISQNQTAKLQDLLNKKYTHVSVALGMSYGSPSIKTALESLQKDNVNNIIILPMYPQYSATTTASVFDAVADVLKQWRFLPSIKFINHYHDKPQYIKTLAESIRTSWKENGQAEKLLLSFHGLPKSYLAAGDPYFCECQKTARLLASELSLTENQWMLTFQSRMGVEEWLTPYTDKTLVSLAKQGVKDIQVACPGFPADCLETLEEINMQNRDIFLEAGGENYHYIPALNDSNEHIQMIASLVEPQIELWQESQVTTDLELTKKLAEQLGAKV